MTEEFKEKQPKIVVDSDDTVSTDFHSIKSDELPPGTLIAGHYEIISTIGEGAAGRVYKARHQLVNSVRAIKLLHPSY